MARPTARRATPVAPQAPVRDPRLPSPGTVLSRPYRGREIRVFTLGGIPTYKIDVRDGEIRVLVDPPTGSAPAAAAAGATATSKSR